MRHQSWKPAGKKIRFHSPGRMTSLAFGLRRGHGFSSGSAPKAGKISGNSIHPAVSIMIPIRIISTPPVLTVYFTTL